MPYLSGVASIAMLTVGAVLLAILIRRRPVWLAWFAVLTVALVPIYWTPQVPGLSTSTAAIVLLPIGCGLLLVQSKFQPCLLDGLVLLLLTWQAITFTFNFDSLRHITLPAVLAIAGPYLFARSLGVNPDRLKAVLSGVVTAGLALSLLAIREHANGKNFFQGIKNDGYAAGTWAVSYVRNGEPRASASFGQPLLLSLFLACAALIVLFRIVDRRRIRLFDLIALFVLLLGLASTGGRLAYGLVLTGLLLYVMRRPTHYALAGLFLVAFAIMGAGTLLQFVSGEGAARDSAQYRENLFQGLVQSRNYSVQGVLRGDPFNAQGHVPNFNGSIDNQFLLSLLQSGFPQLLLLTIVFVAVLRLVFLAPRGLARQYAVLATVGLLSLSFVALLLQMESFFWIFVGGLAAHSTSRDLRSRPEYTKTIDV